MLGKIQAPELIGASGPVRDTAPPDGSWHAGVGACGSGPRRAKASPCHFRPRTTRTAKMASAALAAASCFAAAASRKHAEHPSRIPGSPLRTSMSRLRRYNLDLLVGKSPQAAAVQRLWPAPKAAAAKAAGQRAAETADQRVPGGSARRTERYCRQRRGLPLWSFRHRRVVRSGGLHRDLDATSVEAQQKPQPSPGTPCGAAGATAIWACAGASPHPRGRRPAASNCAWMRSPLGQTLDLRGPRRTRPPHRR
mmetsp:Transcript_42002/g.112199  ORF Transcript_42002/g.112199 Transcript_42002/m.112199 type:complete len:252 (+) Transcript_42002:207-962(+)